MKLKAAICAVILFFCAVAQAQTVTTTLKGKKVDFFQGYELTGTSSYVYDSAGSTGTNSGWVNIESKTNGTILLEATNYYSGTISARIEGRVGITGNIGEITTKTYTASHSIGELVAISENVQDVRVGLKISSPAGSGTVNISGYFDDQ